MTREGYDRRTIYDDRGGWPAASQKRRRTSSNAEPLRFFETLRAAEASKSPPSPPQPPIKAGCRR